MDTVKVKDSEAKEPEKLNWRKERRIILAKHIARVYVLYPLVGLLVGFIFLSAVNFAASALGIIIVEFNLLTIILSTLAYLSCMVLGALFLDALGFDKR